jgi:hypothetical protein
VGHGVWRWRAYGPDHQPHKERAAWTPLFRAFSCVQPDVSFKDCDAVKEPLTKQKANLIRDKFRDANLPVMAVSAYQGPESVQNGLIFKGFARYLQFAVGSLHELG